MIRQADLTTGFRTLLSLFTIYLIVIKYNAYITAFLIIVAFVLDGLDGVLARRQKKQGIEPSKFGPRLDVAGDRIAEYSYWIIFSFLGVIPLFLLFIVMIRHSIADAFMGAKGTSSKLKTKFAQIVYASKIGRGGVNLLKVVTFSYLALVYIAGYPSNIGLGLSYLLVIYILLRGAAEVYENMIE